MSRRLRYIFAGAGLALGAAVLAHPLAAQSASAAMTVSVTVVRPCSVATSASTSQARPSAGASIRIDCGRSASSSSLQSPGILPVAGTRAPAALSTSKNEKGLVVSVNF